MNENSRGLIEVWCQENGWTDLFIESYQYWAFPPGAVMPLPVPMQGLPLSDVAKGLSFKEKFWYGSIVILTLLSAGLSYFFRCPMPVTFAFAFCAIAVALLEDENT